MNKLLAFIFILINIFSEKIYMPYKLQDSLNNEALLQRSIRTISEDRHGLIWFGTYMGIGVYNGYEILTYINSLDNPQLLSDSEVRYIFRDSKDNMWIGLFGKHLNLYDESNDEFLKFEIENLNNSINKILEIQGEKLILSSNHKIFIFDMHNKISYQLKNLDFLAYENINDIFLIDDILYIGTNNQLIKYSINKEEVIKIPFQEEVKSIQLFNDNLIFSSRNKVYVYENNKINKYPVNIDDYINIIYVDSKNNLWLGSDDGLYLKHKENLYKYTSFTREAIVNNKIHSIYESKNNLLWIGTDIGFSYFNLNNYSFFVFEDSKEEVIDAWSLGKDKNNNLLIGSRSKGLVRKDEILFNEPVNTIKYKNNIIYIGSKYNGFFILDNSGKLLKKIKDNKFLSNNQVRSIYVDDFNSIYIGTDR